VLRHTIEEAVRMAAEEFGHFLVGREAAARRYRTLVRRLTEPASWRELREALERVEERSVPGKTVSILLQKLVDAGFVRREDDQYSLTDPMLRKASAMGFVIICKRRRRMRKEVEDWLEQARAELKAAKDNLKTSNFFVSAFLSQQCAEKSLKAYYIAKENKLPPKVHDLVQLSKELKLPKEMEEKLRELSPPYLLARYPNAATGIPARHYDKGLAEKLVKMAEEVLKWVEEKLE
jgi:HEPN domain-containing protein